MKTRGATTKKWNDSGIQGKGCDALRGLAIDADNNIKIGEQGGINVILESMRTHKSDEEVQAKGSDALGTIAFNADNNIGDGVASRKGVSMRRRVSRQSRMKAQKGLMLSEDH